MPAFFVGAMGAFVTFLWADSALRAVRTKVKQDSCEAIASAIGVDYAMSGFATGHIVQFRGLDLLPAYDRIKHEDQFSGAYHGARFALCESHLERKHNDSKGRTSWSTVFRGQCIVLNFPRAFLGVTIVRRDAGIFNFLGGGGALKKVSLEDPVFEKAFEVFSNDQVESRYLLHPVFMQRLVDLEAAFKGKRLRCGFEHGDLMIAVEGGDKFEPGSMFKPLADPQRAKHLVDDVASVMRVMDAVLTAQARRA